MGYSPWGSKESDMTEQLSTAHRETAEGCYSLLPLLCQKSLRYLHILFFGCDGRCCCACRLSLLAVRGGCSLVLVLGLLIAVTSLVEPWALGAWASVVAAHGLSCSVECGIFLDQGSNLCLLH